MRKRSFLCQVFRVAKDFGIEQTSVNRIINSYISICRRDLLSGMEVRFLNLVSLIPSTLSTEEVKTTAFYAKEVAQGTNMPYHTALAVIKNYLDGLYQDIMLKNNVDIRRIVRIHVMRKGSKFTVHSAVSASVKETLQGENSVRVHTSKYLMSMVADIAEVAV